MEEAIIMYKKSFLIFTMISCIWIAATVCVQAQDQFKDVKPELEEKLKNDPKNEELLHAMATGLFWEANDLEAAEPYYRRLIEINPKHYASWYGLAALLEIRGRYQESVDAYREFLKLSKNPSIQQEHAARVVNEFEKLKGEQVAAQDERWRIEDDRATNSIGMSFILIPGGEFTMGYDEGKADQKPEHNVILDPYWIGEYEVTAGEYKQFLEETKYKPNTHPPYAPVNDYARTEDHPVVFMTWREAVAFTIWLSYREDAIYRLPSEAEWELAARGFDSRTNPWGNDKAEAGKHGNLGRHSRIILMGKEPTLEKVGSYPEGKSFFQLYDMAGNADEWCLDYYDPQFYKNSPVRNPFGPVYGEGLRRRVLRGSNWRFPATKTHAVDRNNFEPTAPYDCFGFRIVRELKPKEINEIKQQEEKQR